MSSALAAVTIFVAEKDNPSSLGSKYPVGTDAREIAADLAANAAIETEL
jgi:hypothetical protein